MKQEQAQKPESVHPAKAVPSEDLLSARFRKKPVVIDAWRVHPNDGMTRPLPPGWLLMPMVAGVAKGDPAAGAVTVREDGNGLDIHTLEGVMHAATGDWIIRGVKGELYPCKPDIFAATYEPAADVAASASPLSRVAEPNSEIAHLTARPTKDLPPATAAMHASAPEGCGCADCAIDNEPCPRCYSAWWSKRYPNVTQTN